MIKKFWMVYGVDFTPVGADPQGPPRRVFTSSKQARAVARRLAEQEPGVTFFVLESTKHYTARTVLEGETASFGLSVPSA